MTPDVKILNDKGHSLQRLRTVLRGHIVVKGGSFFFLFGVAELLIDLFGGGKVFMTETELRGAHIGAGFKDLSQ